LVDAELRSEFLGPPSEFQEDQQQVVERCLKLEADTNAEGGLPWIKLKSPALVDKWRQHVETGGERSIATGKGECVIDAPALAAAAWYFMVDGRKGLRASAEKGDPARVFLSKPSVNDITWAVVKRAPFPLHNREFVARQLCFKDKIGRLVVVFEPPMEEVIVDYGRRMKVVRGTATGFVRFTPMAGNTQCKLEVYQQVDAGGRVPVRVVNSKVSESLSWAANMREQFQRDDDIDAAEGGRLAAVIRYGYNIVRSMSYLVLTLVYSQVRRAELRD
jgi:hypothetical protein